MKKPLIAQHRVAPTKIAPCKICLQKNAGPFPSGRRNSPDSVALDLVPKRPLADVQQPGGCCYLQAVISLPNQLFLVGRYEHFRNSTPNVTDNISTVGLNYRGVAGLVFRIERTHASHEYSGLPSGWFASVAVLF
jgi:hypothetical protein